MSPLVDTDAAFSEALREAVQVDADAIERALHDGRLVDLGLRTDDEVRAQVIASLRQAGPGPHAMAGLVAADYFDNPEMPGLFARRRQSALWRSCQLHGVEDEYWRLTGLDLNAVPAPLLEQLGCIDPDCPSQGPFDLSGGYPACPEHRTGRRDTDVIPGGVL